MSTSFDERIHSSFGLTFVLQKVFVEVGREDRKGEDVKSWLVEECSLNCTLPRTFRSGKCFSFLLFAMLFELWLCVRECVFYSNKQTIG